MITTGDCIEVMAAMDADSVDAIVTDPPYGLEFMGKEWDNFGLKRGRHVGKDRKMFGDTGADYPAARNTSMPTFGSQNLNPKCAKCGLYEYGPTPEAAAKRGRTHHKCICEIPDFRGRSTGPIFQEWCRAWGEEAIRITKPGGYLLAFGGTRTHHRLVCGLEDAGWIIRDELDWIYASGFPKGKANLKPAHEPIVLARKSGPLRPLAIDECRIGIGPGDGQSWRTGEYQTNGAYFGGQTDTPYRKDQPEGGRWPSNVLLSDPALFDEPNPEVVGSGATDAGGGYGIANRADGTGIYGKFSGADNGQTVGYGDSGGYSRFFIVPKSARADREPVLRGQLERRGQSSAEFGGENGRPGRSLVDGEWTNTDTPRNQRENAHPTVKPVDLMRHLVRLVTPQGGTVLDCFAGSGSTLIAAELEGFPWLGIEKEVEYVKIAEARLNGTQRGLGLDVPAPTQARKVVPGAFPKGKVGYTTGDSWGGNIWHGTENEERRVIE